MYYYSNLQVEVITISRLTETGLFLQYFQIVTQRCLHCDVKNGSCDVRCNFLT